MYIDDTRKVMPEGYVPVVLEFVIGLVISRRTAATQLIRTRDGSQTSRQKAPAPRARFAGLGYAGAGQFSPRLLKEPP